MILQENKKLHFMLKEKITELERFRIANSELDLQVHEMTINQNEVIHLRNKLEQKELEIKNLYNSQNIKSQQSSSEKTVRPEMKKSV